MANEGVTETFEGTTPHAYMAATSGVDDILNGAEFKLHISSVGTDHTPKLAAKRQFTGDLSWYEAKLPDTAPITIGGDGWKPDTMANLVAKFSDATDGTIAAAFELGKCLAVKWEIEIDVNGMAAEVLYFECETIKPRN